MNTMNIIVTILFFLWISLSGVAVGYCLFLSDRLDGLLKVPEKDKEVMDKEAAIFESLFDSLKNKQEQLDRLSGLVWENHKSLKEKIDAIHSYLGVSETREDVAVPDGTVSGKFVDGQAIVEKVHKKIVERVRLVKNPKKKI
jgi:hypothetical protein